MKLALCLQYWESDRPQAMRLARLIADIEPRRREDVEFVFVRRFDASHPDGQLLSDVVHKFPTSVFTTRTQWSGWPAGPNAMAKDIFCALDDSVFDGILLIEPDCVPLARDWLDQLIVEWEAAHAEGKWIMGAWRDSGGPYGHINGNGVFSADLAHLIPLSEIVTQHLAWDCAIAPYVKDRWHVTGLVKNCFESRDATAEVLRTPDVGVRPPVLIHGFKDDSAYNLAFELITELPKA